MRCRHCGGRVMQGLDLAVGGLSGAITEVVRTCANCGRSPDVKPRVLSEAEQEALLGAPEGKHDSAMPMTTHERRLLRLAGAREPIESGARGAR